MCESSHGERIYDRAFARGLDNHPLNILRARYARGEIGHAEYERTLETLLRNGQTASRARPEGEY